MNAVTIQDFALSERGIQRSRASAAQLAGAGVALALAGLAVALALPPTSPQAKQATAIPATAAVQPAAAPVQQARGAEDGTRRFTGTVGPDLSQSLITAGLPEAQGREYVAVLARAIRLADGLSVDDRFDLVVEKRPDGGLGQLLYVGLDRIARSDVELLKWTDGWQVIWVNADGVGGESGGAMRMPVSGGRISSAFGERFHPILGYARFHKGVDVAAAWGSPIVAAADGRVVSAGWRGGYGRAVEIAHASGLETLYGHMSRIAAAPGQRVRQGEVIGFVGSSGLSTGPHVHFEVLKAGRAVNPLGVNMGAGPGELHGEKLHQFEDELRAVLTGRAA